MMKTPRVLRPEIPLKVAMLLLLFVICVLSAALYVTAGALADPVVMPVQVGCGETI